jgi:hypothetical protein
MVYNYCCSDWSRAFWAAVGGEAVMDPLKVILMRVTFDYHPLMLLLKDCASKVGVDVLFVMVLATGLEEQIGRRLRGWTQL